MRTSVTARRFFDGTTLHGSTRIVVDDGVVEAIEPWTGTCDNALVSPGLVDIQMNGWNDVDVAQAGPDLLADLDAQLWNEGTAHWLGTIVTAPLGAVTDRLGRLHESMLTGAAQGMAGIHLEGPFLGRAPGAHDTRHIVEVDREFVESLPDSVRLVTIAPEADGAADATQFLAGRGVTVSAGHSRPLRREFDSFIEAGATMVTHLFNGMSGIHHRDGGLALWAMLDTRVALGLIGDGHHVSTDAVTLAFTVAPGRVCLVSDSVAWRSPRATTRGVRSDSGVATLPDGTLAGSCTSLAGCLKWVVEEAGVPLATALSAATRVPASVIGREELGTVRLHQPADLVYFDDTLRVTGGLRRLASRRG